MEQWYGKSLRAARIRILFIIVISLAASSGCGMGCQEKADRYLALTKNALENSFQADWITGYDEFNGCDSWDSPTAIVGLSSGVKSSEDVASYMQRDGWQYISGEENEYS